MSPELVVALVTMANSLSDIAFGAYTELKDADQEKVKEMISGKWEKFETVMAKIKAQ